MEKTMHWCLDCLANRRGKWNKVHNEHNKIDIFIKEATEHKCEKQKLLYKMEKLKQKIGELDDQLRLSKENLQAEADIIKDIPPNIAGNAINHNLQGSSMLWNKQNFERQQLIVATVLLRSVMGSLNFMLIHHYQNLVPGIIWIQTSQNLKRSVY